MLWGFLGVLVVLFVGIAVVSRSGEPAITEASVAGEALPQFANESPDPAVGQPAPELTGQTLDGEPITIDPDDGTPKAIVFLAHWCPHCQREVPVVQDWLEENGAPEGVELYAVATDIDRNRGNFPPQDWLEREGWQVPTLVDGDDVARNAYGLRTYPYWVTIDGEGNVVQRWSGETQPDQLEIRLDRVVEASSSSG